MNAVTLTINGRTVHWELREDEAAMLAQAMVQSLGPAVEGSP